MDYRNAIWCDFYNERSKLKCWWRYISTHNGCYELVLIESKNHKIVWWSFRNLCKRACFVLPKWKTTKFSFSTRFDALGTSLYVIRMGRTISSTLWLFSFLNWKWYCKNFRKVQWKRRRLSTNLTKWSNI